MVVVVDSAAAVSKAVIRVDTSRGDVARRHFATARRERRSTIPKVLPDVVPDIALAGLVSLLAGLGLTLRRWTSQC